MGRWVSPVLPDFDNSILVHRYPWNFAQLFIASFPQARSEHMATMAQYKRLSTIINEQVADSRFPPSSRSRFAPRWVLENITRDSIIDHFKGDPRTGDIPVNNLNKSLIDYILNDIRELFAICITIAMPTNVLINLIRSFKSARVTDKSIPRIGDDLATRFPGLPPFFSWSLIGHRYMFQAPEISWHLRHRRRYLDGGIPLPILSIDRGPLPGGFGTVYKITIHKGFLIENGSENKVRCSRLISCVHPFQATP